MTPVDLAVLGLEDREEAGLLGQPREPDRVARRRAPAERAGHEDVQVARAAERHRALDLGLEVAQLGDGRRRHVGDLVRHRDQRHVLALAEDVARLRRRPPWWSRCARPAASRRSAARRCSCRPRCRSRCRARRRCARTSPTGSRSRCRRCRRRRPGRPRARRSRPLAFSAAAMPVATAGALPNSEWIQGSCHEDSGYGVENTSRQPVALAAISWPSVARIAASSA